jgi:hypothetical protein
MTIAAFMIFVISFAIICTVIITYMHVVHTNTKLSSFELELKSLQTNNKTTEIMLDNLVTDMNNNQI